jgi:GTP pyrophosphokinase
VAGILSEMKLDVPSVATGLLHDTIEDTLATYDEIGQIFGKEIADLVDGVTKLGKVKFASKEARQAENFRKMLMAMAKDIRVILVKLADRLHNMRTLEHLPPEKQAKISQETLDIYAPLANRLGIHWLKSDLEDLSFKYTRPEEYGKLAGAVAKRRKEREKYIEEVKREIALKLNKHGFENFKVYGRAKHLYSIHKKLEARGVELDQVYDLLAFRVITGSIRECYEVLGIIHSIWKPIMGRFKDFIAMPKANLYQSLHTTVIGPRGERVEIQIRTDEMHHVAEHGVAAHWRYKEKGAQVDPRDEQKFGWVRKMMDVHKEIDDPNEFLDTVKLDLFSDEVYVFTPQGDVKAFPHGATPVDFAYAIHTEVGHHCVGAKVNGRIVPLKYKLRSGDTVDIITNPDRKPSKDWLNFVVSSRARVKIRTFVKQQERQRGIEFGRDVLQRELKKFGASIPKLTKSGEIQKVAKAVGHSTVDNLLVGIAYGKTDITDVVKRLVGKDKYDEVRNNKGDGETEGGAFERLLKRVTKNFQKSPIRISDVEDILVTFGKCCNPLPGDPVIGFITRGRGLTVHTQDCSRVLASDPERRLEVQWDNKLKATRRAKIRVVCEDTGREHFPGADLHHWRQARHQHV